MAKKMNGIRVFSIIMRLWVLGRRIVSYRFKCWSCLFISYTTNGGRILFMVDVNRYVLGMIASAGWRNRNINQLRDISS